MKQEQIYFHKKEKDSDVDRISVNSFTVFPSNQPLFILRFTNFLLKQFLKESNMKLTTQPSSTYSSYDLVYIPKSFCLISEEPIFDIHEYILKRLYQNVIIPKEQKAKERVVRVKQSLLSKYISIRSSNENNSFVRTWLLTEPSNEKKLKSTPSDSMEVLSKSSESYLQEFMVSGQSEYHTELGSNLFEFFLSFIKSFSKIAFKESLYSIEGLNFEQFSSSNGPPSIEGQTGIVGRLVIGQDHEFKLPPIYCQNFLNQSHKPSILRLIQCILLEKQIIFVSETLTEIPKFVHLLLFLTSPL